MKDLFKSHLEQRLNQVSTILDNENEDCLIIESGFPSYYYMDDQTTFFKANPQFIFFCPDMGQGHILKLKKDQKPKLYYYIPSDFWHETSQLKNDFWESFFDIQVFDDYNEIWKDVVASEKRPTVISPHPDLAIEFGCHEASERLISQINWMRISKSDYEIKCLEQANELAAKGHMAAKTAFLDNQSELGVYNSYLLAIGHKQAELPYESIVAYNEKTAVLHYQKTRPNVIGKTFLIDAGSRISGYCSDITRTYYREDTHSVFKALHEKVDSLQKELCLLVKPGFDYLKIQELAHEKITSALCELGIITTSTEKAMELQLSQTFFPHGIGHALGIQVHDVGGKQKDDLGHPSEESKDHPFLRTLRVIQERDVLTIEPGVYFIPMLLNKLKNDETKTHSINWKLAEELIPLGGVRIEDNIVAMKDKSINLTRPYLPE